MNDNASVSTDAIFERINALINEFAPGGPADHNTVRLLTTLGAVLGIAASMAGCEEGVLAAFAMGVARERGES